MAMRVARTPDGKRPMRGLEAENFKPWHQRTLEERQDQPGDYEAQAGQGPISLHSEEHLVTSDKGIGCSGGCCGGRWRLSRREGIRRGWCSTSGSDRGAEWEFLCRLERDKGAARGSGISEDG
jgi:hypothetical protein